MSLERKLQSIVLAAIFLGSAALACGPTAGGGGPSVTISSPPSGTTVMVGEEVEVVSLATADAGVAEVELSVNGVVVRRDAPPGGNPTSFSVSQPWTPDAQGQVTISVIAHDAEGAASDKATITLQVAAAGGEATVPAGSEETPTPEPDVEGPGGCTLNATYVADVTIPDDTELAPGTAFVKTWRIRNSGTCDWTAGFEFVFVSGDQMEGEAMVAVPGTAAGSTVDLSVNLTAPSAPGTYRGNWRMQSDTGLAFGNTVYVQIVVPAPATDTPAATDTPVPTAEAVPVEVDVVADADTYWWPKNIVCGMGLCPDFGGGPELELRNTTSGSGDFVLLYPGLVAMRFDLGGIPAGATIEEAVLYLYLTEASGASSVDAFARRATSPWSEGDPAVKPNCETTGGATSSVASGDGWYNWDVESIVEHQHANPTTNYGFCITMAGGDNGRIFTSREGAAVTRPYVRVVYLP